MKQADGTSERKHAVLRDAGKVLKVLIPLGVSAALILWLFHKVDIDKVKAIISQGVDYRFIVLMMGITVLSHVIRGIRWGIQLRAAGIPRMPVLAESVSIFGAYALSLVFPFRGGAWRCVYVSKRQGCKLSTVVGTDIGDRASDGIMIGLLILLTLWVAHPAISRFLDTFTVGKAIENFATDGTVWAVAVGVLIALVVLDRVFRRNSFVAGVNSSASRIWRGFVVLFHMKGIGLYLVLTIGIWTCYYLETYVCFYAFPFTREFLASHWGLVPGLVVFVFGSCSMIVPSNGGLGPWNIAVMFALTLLGVSQSDGAAYSLVCWSFQSATLVGCGIFSAFYIMHSRRSRSKK